MRRSTLIITMLSLMMISVVIAAKSVMTQTTRLSGNVSRILEGEFHSETGNISKVKLGEFLGDQLPSYKDCCRGTYKFQISHSNISNLATDNTYLSIFIPALGANTKIKINNVEIPTSLVDFTSVGPVLPLKDYLDTTRPINFEITLSSKNLTFAGLWRGAPYIGNTSDLLELKQSIFRSQVLIPLFDGVIVALLALMFLTIHSILKKRASYFLLFGLTLVSWALFFISLSGVFRSTSFVFGSLLHFPLRTVAGYFSLRLAESLLNVAPWKAATPLVVLFVVLEFILGGMYSQSLQSLLFIAAGVIGFMPIFKFFQNPSKNRRYIPFTLYLVFLLGQTSDAVKLLSSKFEIVYSAPYFNRYTLLPFLAFSFVFALIKFSETFRELNFQLLRARQVSNVGAKLSKKDPNEDELSRLASKIKRLTLSDSSFFMHKTDIGETSFSVLSGNFSRDKLMEIYRASKIFFDADFPHNEMRTLDIESGEKIYFSRINLDEKSPFALIFVRENCFNQDDNGLSFVAQILNILKTSNQRTNERKKREASEERFRSLIQKLDPNLYDYVANNEVSLIGDSHNFSRGIVFFDQKGYTTLLEDLDETSAFALAETVNRWVAERAARYAARILNFNGDAYTLELLPLPGETNPVLAERICNLVWDLSQSVDSLNMNLLKIGLAPIAFRFGANIGMASGLKLDFISPGVMNIVGDNVNVAARLQALARPGSVLVSGELASETSDKYVFRKIPRSYVKGRRREVDVFELVGRVDNNDKKVSA